MSYIYTYGSGTENDPYQVWTAADLDGVRDHLDAYFVQKADIDLSGWNWIPIGHDDRFEGYYDGNNFIINNLTTRVGPDTIPIQVTEYDNIGLFARVDSSDLKVLQNITITNAYIDSTGGKHIGILSGHCQTNVSILNCKVQGTIVTTGNASPWRTGGLIGALAVTAHVSRCYADIEFLGKGDVVGGLIGRLTGENASISQSYTIGSIVETSGSYGVIGGFVAWMEQGATLNNCYSRCDLESISEYTGGLIGYKDGSIINCYSTGLVDSVEDAGGLIGYNIGIITNSYYDSNTSGQSDDDGRGEPRTTAQMVYPYSDPENVYINWAFYEDVDIESYNITPYRSKSEPQGFGDYYGTCRYYKEKFYFFAFTQYEDERLVVYSCDKDGRNLTEILRITTDFGEGWYDRHWWWGVPMLGINIHNDTIYLTFHSWIDNGVQQPSDEGNRIWTAKCNLNGGNYSETQRTFTNSTSAYSVLDESNGNIYHMYYRNIGGTWWYCCGTWNLSNDTYTENTIVTSASVNDTVHWGAYVKLGYANGYLYRVVRGEYNGSYQLGMLRFQPDGSNYSDTQLTFGATDISQPRLHIDDDVIYMAWGVDNDLKIAKINPDLTGFSEVFSDSSPENYSWDYGDSMIVQNDVFYNFIGYNGMYHTVIDLNSGQVWDRMVNTLVFPGSDEDSNWVGAYAQGIAISPDDKIYYWYYGVDWPGRAYISTSYAGIWKHDKDHSVNDGYPYFGWMFKPKKLVYRYLRAIRGGTVTYF